MIEKIYKDYCIVGLLIILVVKRVIDGYVENNLMYLMNVISFFKVFRFGIMIEYKNGFKLNIECLKVDEVVFLYYMYGKVLDVNGY